MPPPRRICSVNDCGRPRHGQGLCHRHYKRFRHHGTTETIRHYNWDECSVEGCKRVSHARGICRSHDRFMRLYGTTQTTRVRKLCSVKNCDRKAHGRGFCLMHLKRVMRHGSTEATRKRRPAGMSVYDWFMSQVDTSGDCWEWTGPILRKRGGYGMFYDADRNKKMRAHHYLVRALPSRGEAGGVKMEYDHLCRNVRCVRPEHLEMVTAAENRRRAHFHDLQ